MVSKQCSKFKQQIPSKVLISSQKFTDDFCSSIGSSPVAFKNPTSTSSNLKIGLFSIMAQSKKNSNKLNASSRNNNSSLGFRQTQTTNYTERNETEESQIQELKTEILSPRLTSIRHTNRERINSFKTMKNENNTKLKDFKIIQDLFQKKRNSEQPSIHQLSTQQSKSTIKSPKLQNFIIGQKSPSFHSTPSQQPLTSPIVPPLNLNNISQASIVSPLTTNSRMHTPRLNIFKQNSQLNNSPNASPLRQQALTQRQISEVSHKKTPFTNISIQIIGNMMNLFKRIKSKVQFFNHITKLLANKSQHLQGIFLIPEIQEVVQDPQTVEKALIHIINSVEYRNSNIAQKGIIKSLLIELSILNKEVFEIYLAQSKLEIKNIRERIEHEKEEVEMLTTHLKQKHFPNFSKKATLFNVLSYNSIPITYKKEKYNLIEEKYGKFNLISYENRFMCSEIEKIVCDLNQISYQNNIPRRNAIL